MKFILAIVGSILSAGLLAGSLVGVRNPVMWADVPDPSLCSDGEKFYLVSTTMHLVPGVPVMESTDMVHWKTVSYVLPRFEPGAFPDGDSDWGRYDLAGNRTAYGQGQWATTIRRHKGRFYVWFVCNGARGYLYTAEKATGPWTLLSRPAYMHDGGLFFDDDGKAYVFYGSGRLAQLKDDLSDVDPQGLNVDLTRWTRTPEETALLEGSHAVKRGDYYYLLMISMAWGEPGRIRREVCYRAKNLAGPYERKVILEVPFESWGGLGQGDIVERRGEWYAMIFQDRGGVGRVPCAMPVRWVDDWPMLGDVNEKDGLACNNVGRIPNDTSRPYPSVAGYISSDDFSASGLSLAWQWNHNPVDSKWSLAERPGWLRLKTATVTDSLFLARNTLTQRMCGPRCRGAVRLDVSHLQDGDRAGLAAFQGDSGVLAVERHGDETRLVMSVEKSVFGENRAIVRTDRTVVSSVPFAGTSVWLRVSADFTAGADFATFDWSADGQAWRPIGSRVPLSFDYMRFFMGTKFGLFAYATKSLGGWVDVDAFAFSTEGHEEPVLELWPADRMPGGRTDKAEVFADGEPPGDTNYTFVSHPTLTVRRAPGKGVHPAMVVCPGGGYWLLAWQKEGVEIADWANRNGFDAFILKYRVPNDGTEAFMDGQRAVSLVRAKAAELEVDPNRIAMIGFSAGANLTARTANGFATRSYARVDAIDDASSRPDAQLLVYPGGLLKGGFRAAPTPDLALGADFTPSAATPPAFITQTEDDFCNVENALGYYLGCRKAKVAAAMLLGPTGGHGYGLRPSGRDNDTWPEVAMTWLKRTFGIDKEGRHED